MPAAFFLPFMNRALDGMLQIVEELGDERVNQRPNNIDNTSTPCIILTHCVGLTRYWLGSIIVGRPVTRDRDAELPGSGDSGGAAPGRAGAPKRHRGRHQTRAIRSTRTES